MGGKEREKRKKEEEERKKRKKKRSKSALAYNIPSEPKSIDFPILTHLS